VPESSVEAAQATVRQDDGADHRFIRREQVTTTY